MIKFTVRSDTVKTPVEDFDQRPSNIITFNTRGYCFQIPLHTFRKFPSHTRLGKLANYKDLSADAIADLCIHFDQEDLIFYFNRDPAFFNSVLNYYETGEFHLNKNECLKKRT